MPAIELQMPAVSSELGPELGLLSESFHRQLKFREQSPIIHAIMSLSSSPTTSALNEVLKDLITRYPLFNSEIIERKGCCGSLKYQWKRFPVPEDLVGRHVTFTTVPYESKAPFEDFDSSCSNPLDLATRAYTSDVIGRVFKWDRGAFEVHVISFEGRDRCDVLWRLHHGIGDGVLLSKVLEDICVPVGGENDANRTPSRRKKKRLSAFKLVGRAIYSLGKVLALSLPINDRRTSLKAPLNYRMISPNKTFASTAAWSLKDAKDAGKVFNATVNDVVMCALSEAMRRYMLEMGDPEAPSNATVRALAIVNTRAADVSGLLREFSEMKAPNDFSYVVPRLPIGGRMSIEERLAFCTREMNYLKSSPEAYLIKTLNNRLRDVLGGNFVLHFNSDYIVNRLTCFFSNLPGPQYELSIAGCNIVRLSNFVHSMMYSCGLSTQSYNGEIVTNCSCDRELVKDPVLFMKFADEAFEEIKKAAKVKADTASETENILEQP